MNRIMPSAGFLDINASDIMWSVILHYSLDEFEEYLFCRLGLYDCLSECQNLVKIKMRFGRDAAEAMFNEAIDRLSGNDGRNMALFAFSCNEHS